MTSYVTPSLCDTVGILHHGKLVQSGAVSDLVHTQNAFEIVLAHDYLASDIVTELEIQELVIEAQNNRLRVRSESQNRVLAALVAAHIQIHPLNPVNQTLEDVYIHSTRPDAELSITR